MAYGPYVTPALPLLVNIWRVLGVGGFYTIPDVVTLANLSPGKRINLFSTTAVAGVKFHVQMELLTKAKTDIRALWNGTNPDLVEVPAGSGRFYEVSWVDDVAKGFANEYRIAWMDYLVAFTAPAGSTGFPATTPVPMP